MAELPPIPNVNLDDTRSQYPGAPGTPMKCFYCNGKINEPHDEDCVVPQKEVEVLVAVRMMISVPRFWDKKQIEFHRNEGTWCSDNWLEELEEYAKKRGCLCSDVVFKVVEEPQG